MNGIPTFTSRMQTEELLHSRLQNQIQQLSKNVGHHVRKWRNPKVDTDS